MRAATPKPAIDTSCPVMANRSATTPQMATLRLNVFMKMSAP
jgi:hypothetical protein